MVDTVLRVIVASTVELREQLQEWVQVNKSKDLYAAVAAIWLYIVKDIDVAIGLS